jgi:hypothetical protein
MEKMISLALIAIFSVTLFSAKENDKTKPKIDLEKYAELKKTIVNDLTKITEIISQKERLLVNKSDLVNTLKDFYGKNSESLNFFEVSIKDSNEIAEYHSFTYKQRLIIDEVEKEIKALSSWDLVEKCLKNKFVEIASNNDLSLKTKKELLKHITILSATTKFVSGIAFGAVWCWQVGGECRYPPCPPGTLQGNPADFICWTPSMRCCIPFIIVSNLSNTNKGILDTTDAVTAIYANIMKTAIDIS